MSQMSSKSSVSELTVATVGNLAAKAAISIGKFCANHRSPRLSFGKVGEKPRLGLPPPRLLISYQFSVNSYKSKTKAVMSTVSFCSGGREGSLLQRLLQSRYHSTFFS